MFGFVFKKVIPNLMKFIIAKFLIFLGYKKDYENCWIISERGNDARDNGYFFFKYLCEQHPEISCYYIIDKESSDYEKVKKIGLTIEYQSFEHFVVMLRSSHLISTHIMGFTPEAEVFMILEKRNLFEFKSKKIFLQHGIIKSDIEGLKYPNVKLDLFVCGAYDEYRYIHDHYRHPEGVVQYTGLARYDFLNNDRVKRQILIMPTWRKWLNSLSEQEFLETEYCKQYLDVLNDGQLHEWLEKEEYELVFYPHYEMQKYVHLFAMTHPNIHVGYFENYDVQTLLKESELLITDYSSVFFDFAYLNKPILYFQFDQEQFFSYHYAKGYFDEKVFGPICKTKKELLNSLNSFFVNSMDISNYEDNQKMFFRTNNGNCCEKIYQTILTINKDGGNE